MHIRNISIDEFNDFTKSNNFNSYHQTLNYALLKSNYNYEYEFIGFCDSNKIYAACLVLAKLINGYVYAYIPEGFLINYDDSRLFNDFISALYDYYKHENIVFIKVNPQIYVSEKNTLTGDTKYHDYDSVLYTLSNNGFIKIEDDSNFNTVLPTLKVVIKTDEYKNANISKNTKNKIRKAVRKGLTIEKSDIDYIDHLYRFTKRKINKNSTYYKDYYNIFNKDDMIDYFLVSINYAKELENATKLYENEKLINKKLNENVIKNPSKRAVNLKIESDNLLYTYKNDVTYAADHINNIDKDYVAGALVIKKGDTATILISGYDKKYKDYAPNYYLYYKIINYYKNKVKYINLNGIAKTNGNDNKYSGLNKFKLSFNPIICECIGEFDLVYNKKVYSKLEKKGLLKKEFEKKSQVIF